MTRPKKDAPRATIYLVKPGRGEWFGTAGLYVGETTDRVVLKIGEAVKGFLWADVDPVEMRETGTSEQ